MHKYLGYEIALLALIHMILLVESENTYNELLFSPKQLNRYSSRVVYYEPKNESVETSTQVPWEDVLKETVILTLNNDENVSEKTRKSSYSVRKRQNQILNASYKGLYDPNIPKFGDIVLLGKGTLEKADNDTYSFIQSDYDCDKYCFERQQEDQNVTAVWTVERIRHRDPDRGHRYELKFTVVPLHENKTNGADTGLRISKSYIVRDEDYPKYFNESSSSNTTPANVNQARSLSILVPRRTLTRRTDASTRRTIFDMFDFSPITNAFTNPFTGKIRPEFNMLDPFGIRPSPNAIRMPPNAIPVVRMPMNKVRFPDQRTPFSGQQSSGVHIFLNGQQRKPSQQVPQATQLGKPGIYDLDKVYDYNKMMDYQGSINAQKVFPDLIRETTEVTDNTLDYRTTTQQQNNIQTGDQKKAGTTASEGAFQYTTVFGPGVQNPAPTQTQVPQIGPQVTTGLLYPMHHPLHTIPFTVPHIPLAPWLFPFGPHPHPPLAHIPPQAPFPSNNVQQHHTQTNIIPHSNVPQLPTTTHYGITNSQQGKDQAPIPPFQPLHHSMAKIRPLSRIPMSPPRKEVNVQIFKESPKEPQHFSAPDPFFPQTSTSHPSTSTYKSVLPSPYSTISSESTTGATVFDRQQHFTHKPVHLTDDEEFQPIKPVVETTFAPTPRTYHFTSSTTSKPNSINSQLPPPERGQNTKIPYMDSKSQTKKIKTRLYSATGPTGLGSIERVKPFKPSSMYSTSTTTGSSVGTVATSRYRNSYKTTEKPVLKWIPKKSRKPLLDAIPTLSSTTSTTTTTARTTTVAQESARTTHVSLKFEPTTIRPRFVPTTTQTTNTATEIKSTVNVATTPSTNRFRGRGRFSLKRRGDNKTYYGSLEDGIASQESKTSISTSVSVESNNRRRLQRKRVSRFNTTTTRSSTTETPVKEEKRIPSVFYVTTTPSVSPFLATTSVEPPSTTPEIIKADVRPLDTKIDNLHLFKATEGNDQSEIPSNINELDNLAVSILEHARSLHSAQNYYNNRKINNNNNRDSNNHYSSNRNNKQNIIDDTDDDKLPLETFFRQ